jgi:hypothetical protein
MLSLLTVVLLVGWVGTVGKRAAVERAGLDELLKMQAAPRVGSDVLPSLPDGIDMTRCDCATQFIQLRYCISLADAPTFTGYISAC